MKTRKIICLYGGPGTGKSTVCAGLFYNLKLKDFNCEMNREYIKEWVWEKRPVSEGDQTYFFAKMSKRERAYIENNLDFIITDSPLILTHFYGMKYDPYEQKYNTSLNMLKNHHEFCKSRGFSVEHYFLTREKEYNASGRFETEQEARGIDSEVMAMLDSLGIKYKLIASNQDAVSNIIRDLEKL